MTTFGAKVPAAASQLSHTDCKLRGLERLCCRGIASSTIQKPQSGDESPHSRPRILNNKAWPRNESAAKVGLSRPVAIAQSVHERFDKRGRGFGKMLTVVSRGAGE